MNIRFRKLLEDKNAFNIDFTLMELFINDGNIEALIGLYKSGRQYKDFTSQEQNLKN